MFQLRDHIYKEIYILYPSAIDAIKENEIWKDMKEKCDLIGYCPFTQEIKGDVSYVTICCTSRCKKI